MDKEIKERIAAINSGIIPDGYKKTKVGIVPWGWEVIKAKEVFSNISNKKHNGDLEVLSSTQDKGIIPRSMLDIDIKYDKESTSNYKKVEKGNFVISLRSFQGGIEYSGYVGLISPAYTVLGSKVEICDDYYKSYLKSPDYIQRLNTAVYGIRDGKNISYDDFSLIYIPFPPLHEQQKIAEMLSTQDKLIELQEKKIEQLKELKKAYLQKMFPKKGSKYPELRFKGFSDPWEQRKLGDMCDEFQSGKSIKASEITDSGEYAVYGGNGFRGYTDTYNHDGDYALIGRQGALCGNMNFSSGKAYFTEHAVAVHGNADNDTLFLYYLLDLMNLGQYSGQSAQPGLAVNKIIQLKTKAPKLDEQRLISSFFKQLDSLITLHQRKSEQEKQKKKALMQLLLTGIVRTK